MQRLAYLETAGGTRQYIDTGYIFKANSRLVSKFICYATNYTAWQGYFGSYGSYKWSFCTHAGGNTSWGMDLGSAWQTTSPPVYDVDSIIESSVATGTHKWKSDNEEVTLQETPTTVPTISETFKLFTTGNSHAISQNEFGKYRFYYMEMYEGDTLVHKWVPVIDDNNVVCIYDTVDGVYKYNAGTVAFTAGPVVSPPTCYIKMTVSAVRSTSNVMQIADLNFYDASDNRIAYPNGTTAATDMTTFSGEGVENILDNNSSTKVCGAWDGSPRYFLITIPDDTFLLLIKKYNYCTANDSSERDPITWRLEFSRDGTNFRELDRETDETITTSRYTQTQKWGCVVPSGYKTSGTAIISLANYTVGGDDALYWTATAPVGTSVAVSTSVNNGAWQSIANAGAIQGLPIRGETCNLRIKIDLATTNNEQTPAVLGMVIRSADDKKVLILMPTMPSDLRGNVGNMSVSYDGLGGLGGAGGPTAAFSGVFTPASMTYRPNPYVEEHVEVSASANVVLTAITYADTQENEHVEVTVSATVTLTDIHDL